MDTLQTTRIRLRRCLALLIGAPVTRQNAFSTDLTKTGTLQIFADLVTVMMRIPELEDCPQDLNILQVSQTLNDDLILRR